MKGSLKPARSEEGVWGTGAHRALWAMKVGGTSGNGKERLRDYSVSRPEIPQRSPNREAIQRKSSQGAKRHLTVSALKACLI